MANQLVPFEMSRALDQIYRLQAQIGWRCARNDIGAIQEAIRADIANLKAAVAALDRAFESEKNNPQNS
jgi:hypothetical protein